jgi:hypothetical protein
MIATSLPRAPADIRRALIALAIASFLGLVSFAAVRSIRVECGDVYLSSDDGRLLATQGGKLLITGQRSCRLAF